MIFLKGGGRRFLTWLLCSFGDWSSSCGRLRSGHLDLDSDDEDDDGDVAEDCRVVNSTLIVMMRMMMVMLQRIAEWSPRP